MVKTSLATKAVAVTLGVLVIAGLTAMPAQAAPKSGLKIAIIPKAINNGYFTAWNKGAQKACKEISATCKYMGPTTATGPAQVAFINQAIQQGYNAIVISAADQNAITPALKKAIARKICIVTSDADITDTKSRTVAVLPASSERIGAAEVDWIAAQIGNKGKVAVLSAAATAANQNAWIEAMKRQLAAKYPNITLAGVYYGDDDATKSAQQYNQILTEHPDIAGIISPTTVGIRAAAQEKLSKGSKVAITGLGLPSEMAPYVLDGTVKEFGLRNPIDLGYVGTMAAAECASGNLKQATGAKFTAGGKSYSQGANGIVYLGDPYKFDKANIATFAKIY
ncbi:MAG: substrate-binding domain-containing protein [Candidatus Nanopelagicales bacterium]